MTPIRQKEALQAELIGLTHLLSITPEDPLATPLMKSRMAELETQIKEIVDRPPILPETELFFGRGAVIGSMGIEAGFASEILKSFQDMVTNHFSAKFCGALRRTGRRRGESLSKLFLTALPTGSFGLQLSQPFVTDFVVASQVTQTMEEITDLVGAAAKGDEPFVDTVSHFNGRVLIPLAGFLESLNNSGSDCKIISGSRRTTLNTEDVSQAYQRVISAKTQDEVVRLNGIFGGVLLGSGRFEFMPTADTRIQGWIAESVTEEEAIEMEKFAGKQCRATLSRTTISMRTGRKSLFHELLNIEAALALPTPSDPEP